MDNLGLYVTAIWLGALHAFEPGHGKSLIAAYMIGSRGRALDGIVLGLVATFTHTFSVIVLGVVAKVLARSYTEAQLHGSLGLVSAVIILGVGIWQLYRHATGKVGHSHRHLLGGLGQGQGQAAHGLEHGHGHGRQHGHEHSHGGYGHELGHAHGHGGHGHGGHGLASPAGASRWQLFLLGMSGGLVPCPAAIATLLAAVGSGRIAEGLAVALAFSLGLGIVMMTVGVVLSQAGRLTEMVGENLGLAQKIGLVSALVITGLGLYTLYHSLQSLGAAAG
ncbi:MAG: sulfite exporter TauE/SafE family protein [Thermodesulfobacteriota bacterium]